MSSKITDTIPNCNCQEPAQSTVNNRITRRQILRTGFAIGAGSLASAMPELASADHFGCRYPNGTGVVWGGDFGRIPDPKKLDIVTIVQKGYCGYTNGLFPGGKINLGSPYSDARTGRLHLWDGYWNQNFNGPMGYTNLMVQPQNGKVFRLYGDWLAKFIERGGPRVFGAPIDDPHAAGPGVEQWFAGGSVSKAAFFRARDGASVYVVQGGILDAYVRERGTSGRLGAPVGNEVKIQGGARSDFANGAIIYQNGAARVEMRGQAARPGDGRGVPPAVAEQFRIAYSDYQRSTGKSLGNPVAGENGFVHKWGQVWTQDFDGPDGRTNLMHQDADGKVYRLYGAWFQKFIERGGPGALGAPSDHPHKVGQSDEQNFTGGGAGQAGFFRRVTNAPIYVVQGSILTRYRQERGTTGRLGAPRIDERPLISGAARSDFEKGSIVWFRDGRTEVSISGQRRQVVVYLSGITSHYSSNTSESDDSKQVRTKLRAAGIDFYTLLFSYTGGNMSGKGEWVPGQYSCSQTFNSLESSTEHLRSLMRSYSEHYPGVDFVVMGHSLGGVVAWKTITQGLDLTANNSRIAVVMTMGSPINGVSYAPAFWYENMCSARDARSTTDATRIAASLESMPSKEENSSMAQYLMSSENVGVVTYVSTEDTVYEHYGMSMGTEVMSAGLKCDLGGHGNYIHNDALWFHLTTYLKNTFMGRNDPLPTICRLPS